MSDAVDALIDTAESERKYWGGESLSLLHLAVAVAKRDPDLFERSFGADGMEALKAELKAARSGNDDQAACEAVLALGRSQSNQADAFNAMAQELRSRLQWIFDAPVPDDVGLTDARTGSSEPHKADPGPATESDRSDHKQSGPNLLQDVEGDERPLHERADQVDELIIMLARCSPMVPVLVGREGSGKTTLLRALAARLGDPEYVGPLHDVEVLEPTPGLRAAPNFVYQLEQVVSSLDAPTIICIEDIEVLLGVSGMGMNGSMLAGLRQFIDDNTARFMFTVDALMLSHLTSLVPEFVSSLSPLEVSLGPSAPYGSILSTSAADLGTAHGVKVSADIVEIASTARPSHVGPVQPGLGISVLDSACVRAIMRGGEQVEIHDLRGADSGPRRIDHAGLSDALRHSVVGQEHVVARVASRLALTQAGLDLRPERPDGVFLFVGPTGVGKTEMARAIAREVFGDEDRLVRLDMSEYVHDWSVSRLIGPQPGYVGSNEPSSWLTTRIAKQPRCVLLLDEIEKSHPVVWNTFLQVFDAGRLTDSRGELADFSNVVVIMTSNLGAEAYSRRHVGFGNSEGSVDQAEAETAETIRRTLSPELINRLDETLVFRPLTSDHIRSIARTMVDDQLRRMAGLGYELSVDDSVIEHLAITGYDPSFGARHLQRNVDRQLLVPLALAGPGDEFHAQLIEGEVRWASTTTQELTDREGTHTAR